MGGVGSGTWCRWSKRKTLEECHRIDVRYMYRRGLLKEGVAGSLSWTTRGEPSGSISYRSYDGSLVLSYTFTAGDSEPEQVEDQIQVEWTPCNYGGHRPWFRCPSCNRRVMVLARQDRLFRCRKCHHIPYGSQTEIRADRLIRKARKIRALVGASDDLQEPIWRKPKGMHRKTFDRLSRKDQIISAEIDSFIVLLLARYGNAVNDV